MSWNRHLVREPPEIPSDAGRTSVAVQLAPHSASRGAMALCARSPFEAIGRTVYRWPLLVYFASLLVPVALTVAVVRAPARNRVPPPPSNASGAPHPRHPRPQPTFAFALASSSPAARLTSAGPAFPAESSQLQYDVALDTGILSFRARDEPYAINYDAVLAAIQWSRGHTRFRVGPPAPPAPADRPPPAPTIERLQSHASYWLTVVYETHPPGGNVLTPERLDAVRRVEAAVLAVEGYENFCRLDVPAESFAAHPEACARWVPPRPASWTTRRRAPTCAAPTPSAS